SDVTAFAETNRVALKSGLQRNIGFVHVCAKTRDASLQASHLEGVPTAQKTAHTLARGNQFVGHLRQRRIGSKQIKTLGPKPRIVCNVKHATVALVEGNEVEAFLRQR